MKIVKILLACIIVMVVIIVSGAFFYLNSKQPKRSGELNLPGLENKVVVHFDKWAIPHRETFSDGAIKTAFKGTACRNPWAGTYLY
ncbi:MAG: hypothetical protein JRJ02_16665 [Deltaproteobacteria bacterium]|nr:hypothetical protein [Deltaproteobacteria bacterium]